MKQDRKLISLGAWLTLLFSLIIAPQYAAAQSALQPPIQTLAPHPLFASDDILKIQVTAPFDTLLPKAKNSTTPYPAQLKLLEGDQNTYDITLAARGKSRRMDYCKFPPLRVKFDKNTQITGEFKGQKNLKLVTHCNKSDKYQQYALIEHGVYQLYRQLSPYSLNTRLAFIDYIDTNSGDVIASRIGFFIEDMDDAAKRNGMKEIDVPKISTRQLNADSAATTVLFQYMIGNVDWSIRSGPKGSNCCHNMKLMAPGDMANIFATPYDFDSSGLVNTPYAEVSGSLPINSVRKRLYRGFCSQNDLVQTRIGEFTQKQADILGVFDRIPGLEDKYRKRSKRYLTEFFDRVKDPKTVKRLIFAKCR